MSKKDLAISSLSIPLNLDSAMDRATLFDRDDPDSVWSRTGGRLREWVEAVEKNTMAMRYTKMSPGLIRDVIKPDTRDAKLRLGFWEEYARAVARDSHMRFEYIGAGVCTVEVTIDLLSDPLKLGYYMNIPASYVKETENLLNVALDRLRDILELPLVNSKGQVQPAVVAGILKAAEMLDKRVKGAVLQKVAVHQHHTGGATPIGFEQGAGGAQLAQDQLALLEEQIIATRKKIEEKYAILPPDNPRCHPQVVEKGDDDKEA